MKKIIVVLSLVSIIILSGCNKQIDPKEETYQRYKTVVVEVIDNDYYIVEKQGYTVGGVYRLYTNNENLIVGDIVYVIVVDDYECYQFSEYLEGVSK